MDIARTKRLMLAELLIFLTLTGTMALVFQPLMTLFNRNIDVVRERIISQAESVLNRPIRYRSMDPSLIGTIEIRTLTVGDKDNPLVASERLFIEYSMWDLIRGKSAGAIRTLILENPVFTYDRDRDGDLRRLFSGGSSRRDFELPSDCVVIVRNGRIAVSHGRTTLTASGISLEGEIDEELITLNGVWQKNFSTDETITMEGSVGGSFSRDFTRGSAALSIDSVEAEGFTIDRIGFGVSFFEDRIVFEREDDGLPLDLSAEYLHENGDFSALIEADRFAAESMIHLRGSAEQYAPFLALRLSGSAGFDLKKSESADPEENGFTRSGQHLSYHFALSGRGGGEESPLRNFVIEGQGDEYMAVFSRLALDAKRGFARYAGDIRFNPSRVRGSLLFSDFSLTGDEGVNGTIVFGRNGALSLDSPSLSFGDTTLSSLSGTLNLEENNHRYVFGFDCYRETPEGSAHASFENRGTFSLRPLSTEGTAAIRNFYAADMLALARPFVPLPRSRASEQVRLSTDIAYEAGPDGITYRSGFFRADHESGAVLSVSVDGSRQTIALTGGTVQMEERRLDFGLNADFSDRDELLFACQLGYLNYAYVFNASLVDGTVFTLQSNHDFLATVQKEGERWSGSALGRDVPIPYGNANAFLSLDTVFDYASPDSWNFILNEFGIRSAESLLSMSGEARENGMNLERIYYTDRAGPLEGSAAAVWNRDFSVIDGSFFLSDEGETEKLAGDIFYEPGNLEFYTNASGFNGGRISPDGRNLRFSGELYGGLSGDGYYLVNLDVNSLTGTLGDNELSLSGLALLDPERLTLSQIEIRSGAMQSSVPYVSLDRGAGRLETEAILSGTVNEQNLGAIVSLGVNFTPMRDWFDLQSLDSSLSGILDVRYAYVNQRETPEPFSFAFSRTPLVEPGTGLESPAVYRISGGPREMLYAEFRENSPGKGVFSLSLGNPSPVQGFITGVLDGTTIDALATEVFVDLKELYEITPISKIVNFTGGTVTGETRVVGSIFDPEFEGTAWATGITLTVPDYVAAEIGPASGIITMEGSGFSFGPVEALAGDGHGIVTGSLGFTRWMTNMDMTVQVDRHIPFAFNLLGIMAKGSAQGTLNLLMEEEALITITGDMEAEDTDITIDQEEIELAMAGGNGDPDDSAEVVADVRLTTGRRVEFLWPNATTPLLRAYGEARTGVQITADTRVPQFSLDGTVTLRGGELYHLQRSFYIREGTLQFIGNAPDFDPLISARAEVRDNNDDGPVTITMVMENVPLSQLEYSMPRYESSPSLSQVEIYSLLGQAPAMGEAAGPSESLNPLISSTSEMILQTIVFRRAEQIIRDTLGLDMFSFRTQILQNALFEAIRNRDPDEQPATMGNYLDNTTVFMGKYIGPELFFQGLLSFRYDQYKETHGGIRVEPEVGFDLRTPLFDVRWSFRPDFRDSLMDRFRETYFVDDQSVTLLWRWSL